MIIAVADIHGYNNKLFNLMSKLRDKHGVDFAKDTFVFLGDYIDGGNESKSVIAVLESYGRHCPHWQFLLGNHEDMMLDVLFGHSAVYNNPHLWWEQGGDETLKSYGANRLNALEKIPAEHLDWIKARPLTFETDQYIFVHAGLAPNRTVDTTSRMLKLWIRDEFLMSKHDWGKKVIAGHTFQKTPLVKDNLACIDTMHHGGGFLTALLLDEDDRTKYEIVQSDI